MSVKQLEAHSADIDRQQALRKLEHSQSAVRRRLNDARDPVAQLPFEISSDIFIRCLPPRPQPGAHHAPMLLLNICNAWTEIAIATPALWVAIHVVFPRANGFHELLGTWLKRARSHSLYISLHGDFDDGVANVVQHHTEHLKNLEIFADSGNGLVLPIRIAPFPSLEAFTLGGLLFHEWGVASFTDSQIVEFLRQTPNLVEWTLDNVCISEVSEAPLGLVLPSLRHLSFGTAEGGYSDSSIIKYLSLPALETLSVSLVLLSTDISDLDLFLRRSSPPLRKLAVGVHARTAFMPQLQKQIVASLRLLLSLTHLELDEPESDIATAIFAALLSDPSAFLPELRSMKMGCLRQRLSDDSYEMLVRVLSLRRAQLVYFELRWSPFSSRRASEPNARLVEVFRQFVAEGMEIHIGTKDLNLI
ncbi:hypothetical protein DFH09DRAFT_1286223 [Mycena vulgaris]|nr:hypothetical protein DFH09DRAFT_1286223 [Mycena vulgaris]